MTVTHLSQTCHTVTHAVSHTTPTRPDPTRPVLTTRDEAFHHSVTYVTREVGQTRAGRPRDVMVKALTRP